MTEESGGGLFAASELVNVRTVTVHYEGPTPLDTGEILLHAVIDDEMKPICAQNSRRLLPTGLRWASQFPEHLQRCPRCVALCPVS